MKKFNFKILGQKYNILVKNYESDIVEISVNGTDYEVEVETKKKETPKTPKLVRKSVTNKPEDAQIKKIENPEDSVYQVIAPLPGNILNILVKEGDDVKQGDTLLVMEAMKMENNIPAEKGGKVKSIKVNTGDNVLQGAVLIEVE